MYNQTYTVTLPTTVQMIFDCIGSSRFNLEIKNTGINAFTSANIKASFTPGGEWQDWLITSSHFDPSQSPQPRIEGLHGNNIYSLAPDDTGVISFDSTYVYQLKIEIVSIGSAKLTGIGVA
jgi:hypothetical protein